MTIYRKSAGSWTTIRNIYRKSGGVWTSIENVYRKANGVWNSVFLRNNSPVIQNRVTIASNVSIITDGETATLTGRNYSWTPTSGLTLTYRFEKSTSITFASSTLVASGSIANPASGSSNTITRSISPSDFSQTDMYFRFRVTAVNSSGTTASVSDVISVSYYGTPVPQSPYPEITGSTTVGRVAFGDIGVWTNSPTSYNYRWYFMSGVTSYPLTFSQSRSVSNKSLSGFSATLRTSANHGYKVSDIVAISSVDSLFNRSNATISSVTSDTITYTINTPTAWADAGTGYASGTYVSSGGSAYIANQTISSVSPFNGGTLYSSGTIVYSGSNRYQSKLNNNIGNSVTNTTWWNNLGSFAPGGSVWTIQNFSNAVASGTTTGPNYYEGTVSSSTSIALTVPTTDYRSGLDMISKALYFGVKAYNPATTSPSESANYKIVYGVPVITIETITATSTTASIAYTQSHMTEYDIDIKYAGSSISGYPRTVTSPSTPISITGLLAPREYSYTISPKNGEKTFGTSATGTFNTVEENWTVTWGANGGTGGGTTIRNKGLAHTAPSPGTRDGFDFVNYRFPASGGTDPVFVLSGGSYTPTADTTFGAQWTAKTYAVTFDANGGTGAPASQTKIHGTTLTLSSTAPTRATVGSTQYTFNGWNTAANGTGTSYAAGASYTLNAPLSLFAQWTVTNLTWTITWAANGGTGGGSTTQNRGVSHTAPSPGTRTGYNFSGWRNPASGDILYTVSDGGTFNPTSDITFTAVWSLKTYTVSFNANGGTGAPASQTKTHDVSLTLSSTAPTRTGYTFNGWNTAADGTGTNYSAGGSYATNADLSLFAKWTLIQYTVTWDANGGTVSPTSSTVNSGSSVTAPTPTRAGFNFSTWRNPISGGDPVTVAAGGSYTPTASITFYAIWTAIPVAGSVSSIAGSTGGRNGGLSTSPWRDPKSSFSITFANTTSATARIQRSLSNDFSTPGQFTNGAPESLTIASNIATITTNQPTGTTSTSANFYYRVQITIINGTTLASPITSASIQNTVTAKSGVAVYP